MKEEGNEKVLNSPTARSIAILLLSMTFVLLAIAVAEPVKVWVNAPEYVGEGATFVATIDVDYISNFNMGQFDLSFNSSVVAVTNVEDGCVNSTRIPVNSWAFMDENTIRVFLEIPGVDVASGSGYLAKISFDAIGKEGDESVLNLSNGQLVGFNFTEWGTKIPEKIPAEWIDAEIRIVKEEPGPTPTPTPTQVHNLNTGENFSSIQAAIDDPDTKDGHVIEVEDGVYYENVKVNKSLTIRSENGSTNCIVQAERGNDHVIEITANYASISGFTVKGALAWGKAGIYLNASHCIISNNNCTNNWDGISISGSSNSISNNTCYSNNGNGLFLSGQTSVNNILSNNTISSNTKNGIYLLRSPYNDFHLNVIDSNRCGIDLDSANNLFYLNNFVNNSENICLWGTVTNIWNFPQKMNYTYNGSSYTNYMGNYWSDYKGTDANNDGLGDIPYIVDRNNDNYPLMESFENYHFIIPGIHWVVHKVHNLNTGKDFLTIQGAIDDPDTKDGHVIEVEDGVYYENVKVTKSLTIRSENGSANCIVQAAKSDYVFNITTDYVNISGFTVEGATTALCGTGIFLFNASYCNVSNNNCTNNFRGIFLSHSNNNIVSKNNCSNNLANGIRLEYSNNNTISNNNCITDGIQLKNSSYNIISYNNCWIFLSDSSNNFMSNNNCTNNADGVHLVNSSYNIISDNNCSSNRVGISLWHHSNDNSISNNNCSSNNEEGINLLGSHNNTISNNDCSNNGMETGGRGIALWASSNNFIINNKVSFNGWNGILLTSAANLPYSSNNRIVRNAISNNGRLWEPPLSSGNAAGISLTGSNNSVIENTFVNDGLYAGWHSTQNEVRDNTVNGKPLVYLENESDREIKGAGQVILLNCDNITVENSDLSHTFIGIHLRRTNNCKITKNNISSNCMDGIYLDHSSNNTIRNNNINSNNRHGIYLWDSSNKNTINENIIKLNNVDGCITRFLGYQWTC